MIGWFDTREVDEFARSVAQELLQRLPPAQLNAPDKKAADRLHRMNESISGRVKDFAGARPLNLYKRARLGNQVKWALKDAGYPADFVEAFTSELVTLVAVAAAQRR